MVRPTKARASNKKSRTGQQKQQPASAAVSEGELEDDATFWPQAFFSKRDAARIEQEYTRTTAELGLVWADSLQLYKRDPVFQLILHQASQLLDEAALRALPEETRVSTRDEVQQEKQKFEVCLLRPNFMTAAQAQMHEMPLA